MMGQLRVHNKQTLIARDNFALFMDNLPGYAWMKDIQGRYVYVNQRVTQEMVPFRGDWFQKTDAELWPHQIASEYSTNDQTVVDTRSTLQIVENYIHEGVQGYVLVTKFPIFDEAGTVVMIGGTSVDITALKRVEHQLTLRNRQQNAIAQLGHQALTGASMSDLLNEAVTLAAGILEIDYCSVLEILPDEKALVIRACIGWKPQFLNKTAVPAGAGSPSGYALLHNQTVIFEDLPHDGRFENPTLYRDHKIISGAVVPIAGRHGSYGVLHALSAIKRKFTADDVSFLESITNIVTTVIQRRSLEKEIFEIAENEQRRIGEDLHDSVCQDLISAGLFAKSLQQKLVAKSLPESNEAGELMRIACETAKRIREIARGFIPADLNADSFVALLRAAAKDVNKRSSIMCQCRISRGFDIPGNFVAYQLFRIVQESLNNVIKHSHATKVWIVLNAAHGKTKLTVTDNGTGFLPRVATEGMGLHIMRYRASSIDAIFSIECRPAGGTIVSCKLENSVRNSVQEPLAFSAIHEKVRTPGRSKSHTAEPHGYRRVRQ